HSPLHVHAHDGPHVSPRTVLPGITFPGLASRFARSGDGVEPPDQLPRPDIKGANISAGPFRREFLDFRSGDDQVFINGGRRRRVVPFFRPFVRDPRAKINGSTLAEALARAASSRIQSKEARVQGDIEEPLVELVFLLSAGNRRVSLPVGSAAIGHGAARAALGWHGIEHPKLFSRFCIYRNRVARLGREVKRAVHHQGGALKSLNPTIGTW